MAAKVVNSQRTSNRNVPKELSRDQRGVNSVFSARQQLSADTVSKFVLAYFLILRYNRE